MRGRRRHWRDLGEDWLADGARERNRHDQLIPMINVVFLLLTFFLIAGTIRIGDGLNIAPPEAETDGTIDAHSPVLSVETSGVLHFQGRTLPPDEAVAAIRQALDAQPHAALHIKADRQTPAVTILPLLQKLNDAGIETLRLIAVGKAG